MSLREKIATPQNLLILMSVAMPLSFSTWQALINNFAIEEVAFSGREIGILQSLREIPGFLAFTAVYLLLLFKEQTLALISLAMLGVGVMVTGQFASVYGLYITTVLMSVGFHYYETMQQSLSLQWLPKANAAHQLGRQISAKSLASLLMFGLIWLLMEHADWSMGAVYFLGGSLTLILVIFAWMAFPHIEAEHPQHKKLILRKRYSLYYALTFLGGARRQIFVVFAGFLLVEKFSYSVADMSLLLMVTFGLNFFIAPRIGRLIQKIGERATLTLEYLGLIVIFMGYAFVSDPLAAATLYVADHVFFAMAIAMKTYFQKIADPRDMAATAGVAFSINHVAAVALPAAFGLLWLWSPSAVFVAGAGIAVLSLILARLVPEKPVVGHEWVHFNLVSDAYTRKIAARGGLGKS